MSLPQFCLECGTILEDINPVSRTISCDGCSKVFKLSEINGADTTVLLITEIGDKARSITKDDVSKLSGLSTTSAIHKDCSNCGYNICSVIYDDISKFYFVCNACNTIY